jgi:hypothetical protein
MRPTCSAATLLLGVVVDVEMIGLEDLELEAVPLHVVAPKYWALAGGGAMSEGRGPG